MKNSEAFKLFKEQKLLQACRTWAATLRKNAFRADLIHELDIARREINQMDVSSTVRSQFIEKLDLICSWYQLEKSFELEIKAMRSVESSPFSIIFHEQYIYMSEEFHHCLRKIDTEKQVAYQIGQKGQALGDFWYPSGLLIVPADRSNDNSAEIICCDCWNHRLQAFDLNGNFKRVIGRFGHDVDDFKGPYDLTLSEDNCLWVADRANHRIKKISLNGDTLEIHGTAWGNDDSTDTIIDKMDYYVLKDKIKARFLYPGGIWTRDGQQLIISDRNSTYIEFGNGQITSHFGNSGPLMPRNLTGDNSRLLVKDEVTGDLFCMSQKGIPLCRFEKDGHLFVVKGSSHIMEIDSGRFCLYQFKEETPSGLAVLFELIDELDNREMLSYALKSCCEEDTIAGDFFVDILEQKPSDILTDNILLSLAEAWQKRNVVPKGFFDLLLDYLNINEKNYFHLYGLFKKNCLLYADMDWNIIRRRTYGETDDILAKEIESLNELRDKIRDDATVTMLEMRKALKIFNKTIKMMLPAIPVFIYAAYANFVMRLLSTLPYLFHYVPDERQETSLISKTKEMVIHIADLLCEKKEYSTAFELWKQILSIDPMNKAIHQRFEALIQ